MVVRIRRARAEDAAGIAGVYVDSWRETYAGMLPTAMLVGLSQERLTARWQRRLKTPSRRGRRLKEIFVAVDDRAGVVGFGACGPSRDTNLGFVAEVYTLYVHPNHLGRGLGSALLSRLFDSLIGQGIESAIIWALSDNPCRYFYSAIGGRIVAERTSQYWGRELREMAYGWPSLIGWRALAP